MELKLQDYLENPANMLYLWASNLFLAQLDKESRDIITKKRFNQRILVNHMAKRAGRSYDDVVAELAAAFEAKYGMAPKEALDTLAAGGEVCDKNWKEGIYGIGALPKNSKFSQNAQVTVDPTTGVISYKGTAQDCTPVYKGSGDKSYVAYRNCVIDGNTYSSYYDKKTNQYYAYQYAPAGTTDKYNSEGQQLIMGSNYMTGDMWEDIMSGIGQVAEMLIKYVKMFIDVFGGTGTSSTVTTDDIETGDYDMPTPVTTIPKQSDGFIFNSNGSVNWGTLGIIGAGAALLMMRRKKRKARRD